jgi:hypothetical protein
MRDQFTKELCEATVKALWRRCEAAKAAGGIPVMDVIGRRVTVPDGWVLDMWTDYYLPQNVHLL